MKFVATARFACAKNARKHWINSQDSKASSKVLSNGERQKREKGRRARGTAGSRSGASQRQGDSAAEGALQNGNCAHANEGVLIQEPHGGAAPAQDRYQHGDGRGYAEC